MQFNTVNSSFTVDIFQGIVDKDILIAKWPGPLKEHCKLFVYLYFLNVFKK